MAARRLLILMLVLLVVSTVAATLVPPPRQGEDSGSRTTQTGTGAEPGAREEPEHGRLVRETIEVAPHGVETVRMRLGDELSLVVRSGVADQVEIPALGQIEDLAPGAPARFDLLSDRTGTFEVRLLGARRVVGRIEVLPRRAEREGPKPRRARR